MRGRPLSVPAKQDEHAYPVYPAELEPSPPSPFVLVESQVCACVDQADIDTSPPSSPYKTSRVDYYLTKLEGYLERQEDQEELESLASLNRSWPSTCEGRRESDTSDESLFGENIIENLSCDKILQT